ncbi:MAG TPA: RNA polymerase subunit sigma-24, partial [Actinobacteria bacterium]|nr:RNA polymerase subunit sigma-24 [Actinomycetota bacterium]
MRIDDLVGHRDGLYRFALSLTRDPDRAADLVQDTFVRAIERADQHRDDAALGAWLRRIL